MVSIIFATYNESVENLKMSIQSVLKQSYNDMEFIVCLEPDEQNKKIIKQLVENHKHVIIESETKMGLTRSLNTSIKESKGKYLARMDSDDVWNKDKLEKQIEFMERYQYDAVGSDIELIGLNNNIIGTRRYSRKSIKANFLFQNGICHPSILLKSCLFEKYGHYDEEFTRCEDLELWLRFISNNVRFGYVPEILMSYRMRESFNRDLKNWGFNLKARLRYIFKIYRIDQALLSIFVISLTFILSSFGFIRLYDLLYQKFTINE
jgi:glycosyltransferase involved in cell wall biosynthesis